MDNVAIFAQELSPAISAANRDLDRLFLHAMSSKEIEGAMRCFLDSPDRVVVLFGQVLCGPAAVRQFLTEMFSRMKTVLLEINEVTHWRLEETVFAVGTATYEFEAQDGARSTLNERWTDARQRVDGRWVYVLDHATQIV